VHVKLRGCAAPVEVTLDKHRQRGNEIRRARITVALEGSEHALAREARKSRRAREQELGEERSGADLSRQPFAAAKLHQDAQLVEQIGKLVGRSGRRHAEQQPGVGEEAVALRNANVVCAALDSRGSHPEIDQAWSMYFDRAVAAARS
jgi:hypothetical protein